MAHIIHKAHPRGKPRGISKFKLKNQRIIAKTGILLSYTLKISLVNPESQADDMPSRWCHYEALNCNTTKSWHCQGRVIGLSKLEEVFL